MSPQQLVVQQMMGLFFGHNFSLHDRGDLGKPRFSVSSTFFIIFRNIIQNKVLKTVMHINGNA